MYYLIIEKQRRGSARASAQLIRAFFFFCKCNKMDHAISVHHRSIHVQYMVLNGIYFGLKCFMIIPIYIANLFILPETDVWPILFLLNVSTALKGTHNYIFIS